MQFSYAKLLPIEHLCSALSRPLLAQTGMFKLKTWKWEHIFILDNKSLTQSCPAEPQLSVQLKSIRRVEDLKKTLTLSLSSLYRLAMN